MEVDIAPVCCHGFTSCHSGILKKVVQEAESDTGALTSAWISLVRYFYLSTNMAILISYMHELCWEEGIPFIAMATGGHNQQTVCTDKQSQLWILIWNYYMLPHCLGCSDGTHVTCMCEHYHDNQNVNLPPITRLCNWEYRLGCTDWSFTLELKLKMVQNDTNRQIGLFTCNCLRSMAWLYTMYCR